MKAIEEIELGFRRMTYGWVVVIGAGAGAWLGAHPVAGIGTGFAFALLFAWAYGNDAR